LEFNVPFQHKYGYNRDKKEKNGGLSQLKLLGGTYNININFRTYRTMWQSFAKIGSETSKKPVSGNKYKYKHE